MRPGSPRPGSARLGADSRGALLEPRGFGAAAGHAQNIGVVVQGVRQVRMLGAQGTLLDHQGAAVEPFGPIQIALEVV